MFLANCSCDVKESSSSITDLAINKAKLALQNFRNIKNFANFNFLVCNKILFNKEAIIKNIGSYTYIVIIVFQIITLFIFYMKHFSLIKMKIKDIIFAIKGNKIIEENKNRGKKGLKGRTKNKKIIDEESQNKSIISSNKSINKSNQSKNSKKKNTPIIHINNINSNFIYNIDNEIKDDNIINIPTLNIVPKNDKEGKDSFFNLNCNNQDKTQLIKNILNYIDEEINILPFDLAIQYDKRSYCSYYISLLKSKHILIFALLNNDYNSRIIKMSLFLLGFSIYYVINALFYNDDTMHNIYESKGRFDLEVQLPIIIYSSLISMLLNTPLSLLALSNDLIISFKQNKSTINLVKREEELINKLTIKFILYFIISFALLGFFWYYISMFGAIYRNTQVHLLKDTIISFVLSLVYPFGIYLIPGLFRIPALSNRKNKRECLYNFSKVLQLL